MNPLEKNLLDLKHSLYSQKASLFSNIGFGGFIAISFGLIQLTKDILISILVSLVWLNIFIWVALKNFSECTKIQDRISERLNK